MIKIRNDPALKNLIQFDDKFLISEAILIMQQKVRDAKKITMRE